MSARRGDQEAGRNARRKQAGARGRATAIGADAATGEVLGLDVLAERDAEVVTPSKLSDVPEQMLAAHLQRFG